MGEWLVMGGLGAGMMVGLCCRRKRRKPTKAEKMFPVPRYVDPTVKKVVWETERLKLILGRPALPPSPQPPPHFTASQEETRSTEGDNKEEDKKGGKEEKEEEASPNHHLTRSSSDQKVGEKGAASPNVAAAVAKDYDKEGKEEERESKSARSDKVKAPAATPTTGEKNYMDLDVFQRLSPHDAHQYLTDDPNKDP